MNKSLSCWYQHHLRIVGVNWEYLNLQGKVVICATLAITNAVINRSSMVDNNKFTRWQILCQLYIIQYSMLLKGTSPTILIYNSHFIFKSNSQYSLLLFFSHNLLYHYNFTAENKYKMQLSIYKNHALFCALFLEKQNCKQNKNLDYFKENNIHEFTNSLGEL